MSSEPIWKGTYNSGAGYGQSRFIDVPTDPGDRLVVLDATGATSKNVYTPVADGLSWAYITGVYQVASHCQTDITISSPSPGGTIRVTVPTNNASTTVPWAFSIFRFGGVSGWGAVDSRVDVNGINVVDIQPPTDPPRAAVCFIKAGWNGVDWPGRSADQSAGPSYEQMYTRIGGRLTVSTGVIYPSTVRGARNVGQYTNAAGEVDSQSAFVLFGTMQPVERGQATTYGVRKAGGVSTSISTSYEVFPTTTPVDNSRATNYGVRDIVAASRSTTHGVRVAAPAASAAAVYAVRRAMAAAGLSSTWGVRQGVSGAQGGQAYDVAAVVAGGRSTAWAVADQLVTQVTSTFGARRIVGTDTGELYGVRVAVGEQVNATDYGVRVGVESSTGDTWRVAFYPSNRVDESFDVRAIVTASRSSSAPVRRIISTSRANTYGVRRRIADVPKADTYGVRLAVESSTGDEWYARAIVEQSTTTDYEAARVVYAEHSDEYGNRVPIDMRIDDGDSFDVRAIVSSSASAVSPVRSIVSTAVATSWYARQRIVNTRATAYPVKRAIVDTNTTAFRVAQAVDASASDLYRAALAIAQDALDTYGVRRRIVDAPDFTTWAVKRAITDEHSERYGVRIDTHTSVDELYGVRIDVEHSESGGWYVRRRIVDRPGTERFSVAALVFNHEEQRYGVRIFAPTVSNSTSFNLLRKRTPVTAVADIGRSAVRVAVSMTRGAASATLGRRRVRAVINGDGQ